MRFAVPWILAFLLLIPGGCWAISLYDVIQLSKAGYSDSRIIELIKVTESRFQLDADNIITLKQAGVSEKVIQVVIEASEPAKSPEPASPQQELEKGPSESESGHQHSHEHNEAEENHEPSSRPSTPPVTEQSRPPGPSQRSISPSGPFDDEYRRSHIMSTAKPRISPGLFSDILGPEFAKR